MTRPLLGIIGASSLLIAASLNTANAADMAVKAPPAPPAAPSWTGFYIGGEIGGGWDRSRYTTTDHTTPAGAVDTERYNIEGVLGGGQAGYRWQSSDWVFGVEGTLAGTNIKGNIPACGVGTGLLPCTAPPVTVTAGFTETRQTEIRDVASATVQVGHTWSNALWYVKGGWGGGQLRLQNSLTGPTTCTAVGNPSCAVLTKWANGGTIGTGIEYLVSPNVSVGIEYDYFGLRASSSAVTSATGVASTFANIRDDLQQVVFRLNYRFGAGQVAAPMVTK